MKILNFSATNHRSFANEFTLDLTRPHFKTNLPKTGTSWSENLYNTAVIYGANAAGKTNIIDALFYFTCAVSHSAGSWLSDNEIPLRPFALCANTRTSPSSYSLDFLLKDDVWTEDSENKEDRFHYEFSIGQDGIEKELLQVYKSSRPTTLINREKKNRKIVIGGAIGKTFEVSPKELTLSRAIVLKESPLYEIGLGLVNGLEIVGFHDYEKKERISRIIKDLRENKHRILELVTLAQVADIGIRRVSIEEKEAEILKDLPEEIVEYFKTLYEKQDLDIMELSLRFIHGQDTSPEAQLTISDQSDGTLAWLALAFPILDALKEGSVLCVDEIDNSIHPTLATELVRVFQDPETNPNGAQLIFTTHDISFITPQAELDLKPKQIWITAKNTDGASELYSLQEFSDIRKGSNLSKQYLEGRFGGIPRLAPALISCLLLDNIDNQAKAMDYELPEQTAQT